MVETIEFDDDAEPEPEEESEQEESEKEEYSQEEPVQMEETINMEMSEEEPKIEEIEEEMEGVKVIKQFERVNEDQLQVERCPVCSQQVPSATIKAHLAEHLRDERADAIKKELEERKKQLNTVSDGRTGEYLKQFAANKPEIFGEGAVNEQNRAAEEANANRPVWDGVAPNLTRTSANLAMISHSHKKNYDGTIEQLDLPKVPKKKREPKITFLSKTVQILRNLLLKTGPRSRKRLSVKLLG